jgi:hypothetical protein
MLTKPSATICLCARKAVLFDTPHSLARLVRLIVATPPPSAILPPIMASTLRAAGVSA